MDHLSQPPPPRCLSFFCSQPNPNPNPNLDPIALGHQYNSVPPPLSPWFYVDRAAEEANSDDLLKAEAGFDCLRTMAVPLPPRTHPGEGTLLD